MFRAENTITKSEPKFDDQKSKLNSKFFSIFDTNELQLYCQETEETGLFSRINKLWNREECPKIEDADFGKLINSETRENQRALIFKVILQLVNGLF